MSLKKIKEEFGDQAEKQFEIAVTELLYAYSEWLGKKGYLDSDWYTEEPNAVFEFIRVNKK